MEMWKWESGGRWSGVCGSAGLARARAEAHLALGDTARVERVLAELSFRTMSSFYARTGDGWAATREVAGPQPVRWQPLGPTVALITFQH